MANQGAPVPKVPPQNDLYTLLLIVAAGLLLFGIVFVTTQTLELYEALLPPAGG